MKPAEAVRLPRPYWHVDAKWITAILLLFLLNVTGGMFILMHAVAPQNGIELLATLLASSFSYESGRLDASVDVETMRREIAASPNGEWQPIPGLNIVVREQDIAGKTPREARLWFFRQWAEPLYYQGAAGLASLASDPELRKSIEEGVGPLSLVSVNTHRRLQVGFALSALASLIFLGLLALFSYRFGRLGSPGCILFLAAIPGVVILAGARGWLGLPPQNPAGEGPAVLLTRYAQLAADVLPPIIQQAFLTYLSLMLLGLLLALIALAGAVFTKKR